MQNIFKNLDAHAPSHMNAFDLSQRHIFSLPVGLKSVVCAIDCMPKDYFEVDFLSLVRSMPINTAAFARMKVQFDAVFVPYQQLWHGWNQFYLQTEENMSVGTSFDHTALPYVTDHFLFRTLYELAFGTALLDAFNILVEKKVFVGAPVEKPVSYRAMYNQIVDNTAYLYNINKCLDRFGYGYFGSITDLYDDFGYPKIFNMIRFLDMLGYGNYMSWYKFLVYTFAFMFKDFDYRDYTPTTPGSEDKIIFYDFLDYIANTYSTEEDVLPYLIARFHSDVIDISDSSLGGLVDWFSEVGIIDASSYQTNPFDFILQSVGFFYRKSTSDYGLVAYNYHYNIFRALAYQKAWQDFTMNKRQSQYDPSSFNVDNIVSLSNPDKIVDIFTFKYESWSYDLFTGVFNSPQTGDVSLVTGGLTLSVGDEPVYSVYASQGAAALAYTGDPSRPAQVKLTTNGPSVYDIKRAEYLQRWKENHLRAGNKLQNQALGQWNTRFKYLSDEYSDFITSWEMPVNIDEVINTADNQGDISGKGIGTSNGHFTYRTNDAGVILIMVSVVPRAEYDSLMCDKINTCLEYGDFPNPFFDNLGFEAIPAYLLNNNRLVTTDEDVSTEIVGYSVRYSSWKTAVDKVHGEFMSSGRDITGDSGSLSIWAAPRKDLEFGDLSDKSLFYINPNVVDTLFGSFYDGSEKTDHFIFNCNVLCKVIRNLSVTGQINWGV